jgi:shikimate kinase
MAVTKRSNIFLVGPMGSGKTAVGRQLARRLGMPFVDSDHEIEERTGVDIPLIFDREGEAGFRRRESEVLDELTARSGIVLSTGGGAVLLTENRSRLHDRGFVVYLETSVADQAKRVSRSDNRPLLSGVEDVARRLQDLMNLRAPLYEEVAHLRVRTDGRRVQGVMREILQHIAALTPPAPEGADRILLP